MPPSSHGAPKTDASRPFRLKVVGVAHHYRVVAAEPIPPGRVLFPVDGATTDRPSRYSIQIDDHAHVDVGPGAPDDEMRVRYPWRFVNHSCEPNAVLRGRDFVALRAINAGEHITFNYNTTESDMAEPFDCRCGHDRCVGHIRGFAHLPPAEQARLLPWLADHLRQRLDSALRSAPA